MCWFESYYGHHDRKETMFIKSNEYSYVNINTGVVVRISASPQCFSISYEGTWPFRKEIHTPYPLNYHVQVRVANQVVERLGSFDSDTEAVSFLEDLVNNANSAPLERKP